MERRLETSLIKSGNRLKPSVISFCELSSWKEVYTNVIQKQVPTRSEIFHMLLGLGVREFPEVLVQDRIQPKAVLGNL